jgi:hypothetical protein
MASSSEEDDSQSGVSENPRGKRTGYNQASATLVNPMGYDSIDESQPPRAIDPHTGYFISVESPPTTAADSMTYNQASASFVNPMGYDEVEAALTARSQVRSIFSGGSNHSGRSRPSDKGQKPHIMSTPLRGGHASTKGTDPSQDQSVGEGHASAPASVPRSGGFASAAGVNQRLSQELFESQRAYRTECEEFASIRDALASALVETRTYREEVGAFKMQMNSISEANNQAQEEFRAHGH